MDHELVGEKEIDGIRDLRDESDENTRIVIEPRSVVDMQSALNETGVLFASSDTHPGWDVGYLLTFVVMLAIALLISGLTLRIRAQAETARERERRTAALYAMSRDLAGTRGRGELVGAVTRHVQETFGAPATPLWSSG